MYRPIKLRVDLEVGQGQERSLKVESNALLIAQLRYHYTNSLKNK
jgi:hypothetical protein